MATANTGRTSKASASAKATAKKEVEVKPVETVEAAPAAESYPELDLGPVTGTKVPDNLLVKVRSNVFGGLIYENHRSGEVTEWSNHGDVQFMTVGELRTMKAEQSAFFRNQWIVITGVADGEDSEATCADIYTALAIKQYYKNYIEPGDFGALCNIPLDKIEERVSLLSKGQKENLVVALNEYIASGQLDSIRRIRAFEEALGVELLVEN